MARVSLAALVLSAATAAFASFIESNAEARVVIATNAETVPLAVQIGTTVDTTPIVEWERVELRASTGALWFLVPVDPGDHVAIANEAFLGDIDRLTAPQLRRTSSPSCKAETAWGTAVDPGAPVLLGRTIRIDDDAALSAFFGAERVTVPAALLGALQGHLHRGGGIEALEARAATSGNLVAAFRTERRTSGVTLDWILAGTTSVPVTSFLFAKTSAEAGVVHNLALGPLAHRKSDLRADYLDLVATSLAAEAEDVALLEASFRAPAPLTAIEADREALASAFGDRAPWVTRLAFAIPPKARGSLLVPRVNGNDEFKSSFSYEDAVCSGDAPAGPLPPPIPYNGGESTVYQGTPVAEGASLEEDDRTADAAAACTLIAIESCSSASSTSGGDDDDDSGSSDDSCSNDKKDSGGSGGSDDESESDEPIDLGSKKGLELGHHRVIKKRSPVSRIAIGACAIVLPLRRRKRRE